ncbi:MAG: mannose-6-phosphate isomerase, class I, partial [Flavisolibacter sp.]|nr:mannose-6-phosphate isomerase, class I [Flavisolibacter sp.]
MKPFFKLRGVVQHYAWGGYQFLPLVLGMNNPSGKPFAEYWLGAHPIHPSLIEGEKDLFSFLGEKPLLNSEKTISKDERFPFLLKVLDVRQMLSIQVHPDKKGAIKGFEKETAKGISIQAPERNYKDRNHKPELMVALGDFYLLHGFKNEEGIRNIFQKVPELSILEQPFRISYRALYEEVMRMPQEKVDAILLPLAERILP